MKPMWAVCILLVGTVSQPSFAERKAAPTGQEIAGKAKAAKLDIANSTTAVVQGRKIKVTPANPARAQLADGEMVGVLDTELKGDETNLPPGKYNLFVAKVGEKWHCYAEQDGKIIEEAVGVTVDEKKPGPKKPMINPKGWYVTVACAGGHCSITFGW
jgi:hypothetical protein